MVRARFTRTIFPFFIAVLLVLTAPSLWAQSTKKYWVYFTDKGKSSHLPKTSADIVDKVKDFVGARALARRAKVLSPSQLVDESDLPVAEEYLVAVENAGGILQQKSRWLNAASFFLNEEQRSRVAQFPFVRTIAPVVVVKGRTERQFSIDKSDRDSPKGGDYGASRQQLEMIGVPALHSLGITAYGVRIGMLDSGFRWKTHEALQSRNVIAEYDFISKDSETGNQEGDPAGQDAHGTATMSVLGGYKNGALIGPAYGAEFVLAKTEYIPSETQIEEDNWAAGLEWLEGMGADVVSSSLGYNIFDDGSGYRWENGDFDGRTSVTARAALRAARLGVVLCDAMGNERNGNGTIGTLLTPADADSIISVGAVNFDNQLAGFSSTGPTNDGRIKPDLVAPGVGIYHATTSGASSYSYSQGTSMSTPLAAGCAALLLSLRPELTPIQVRDILRGTALPADSARFPTRPNNFVGWGLVNVLEAALAVGPILSNKPMITVEDSITSLSIFTVSKFGIHPLRVILHIKKPTDRMFSALLMSLDSSVLFPTSGKYTVRIPPEPAGTRLECFITVEDSVGQRYQSPPPSKNTVWQFNYGDTEIHLPPQRPETFTLFQNYPNPFNNGTNILFELRAPTNVEVTIFTLAGQKIRRLFHGNAAIGTTLLQWDGSDERGFPVPSGVYVCRFQSPLGITAKKMLLIR